MLELEHVYSGYGEVKVISDVSLVVNGGEIVTLIGANGVGKSTLLKTISNVGKASCERGTISFDGNDITNKSPYKVIELGLLQIPEGRQIINELTVRENLILGCYVNYRKLGSSGRKKLLDNVFELFPVLRDRMDQISGTLSGGEQQMLAVSRALMGEPKLVLLDEPSLGLAPIVVDNLCKVFLELNKRGLTILCVEQNALIALELGERTYVLEGGRVAMEGKSSDLLHDDNVRKIYLGIIE